MLIVEIAAGVVLAVLVLVFWRAILSVAAIAAGFALVVSALLILPSLSWDDIEGICAIVASLVFAGFFVTQTVKEELASSIAQKEARAASSPLEIAEAESPDAPRSAAAAADDDAPMTTGIRGLQRR